MRVRSVHEAPPGSVLLLAVDEERAVGHEVAEIRCVASREGREGSATARADEMLLCFALLCFAARVETGCKAASCELE